MNWGSILLAVIGQLVALLIALAMIATSEGKFERVVICALVLLYLSVNQVAASLWRAMAHHEQANLQRFLELKTVVRQSHSAEEWESLNQYNDELSRHDRLGLVRAIGSSIIAAIAIVALIGAL